MVQKAVTNMHLGLGVPGEFFKTEPQRTQSKILSSASEALNKIGVATVQSAAEDNTAIVGGAGAFAGLIVSPKSLVRQTLDNSTEVRNNAPVELALQGYVVVSLPAAAKIGDWVYFTDADGTLQTTIPDATAPVGATRLPGGVVTDFHITAAGVAVIYLDAEA